MSLGDKKEEWEKQEWGGREEEEKEKKYRRKKEEREHEKEKERRCTVKNATSKGSSCIFHFPLLSILLIFRHHTPLHIARSSKAKPRNAIPATVPTCHFDMFTIGQWCSDGNFNRTLSKLACCKQIKLL